MFFTQLAELLDDRQELRITVKKVDGDLVTITNTDFKNKGEAVHITGTPAELDEAFVAEIKKPLEAPKATFQSNADEVAEEIKKEAKEDADSKKKPAKPAGKANAKKKSAPVKAASGSKKKPIKKAEQLEIKPDVSEEFDKLMAEAKLNIDADQHAEAIQYLEAALELNPDNKECKTVLKQAKDNLEFNTHMDEGKACMDKKDFQGAVDNYTKAIDIFPKDDIANSQLGIARKKLEAYNLLNDELV